MYIPNPSKPGEAQEIEVALHELMELNVLGHWNLSGVEKWLRLYPSKLIDAAQRLNAELDKHYPPLEGEL